MRRRKEPLPDGEAPPVWVRQMLPGLRRFGGDLKAWRRARAQWCKDNRCRQPTPCTEMEQLVCHAAVAGNVAGGVFRIGRTALADLAAEDEE